jgi:putative transposase
MKNRAARTSSTKDPTSAMSGRRDELRGWPGKSDHAGQGVAAVALCLHAEEPRLLEPRERGRLATDRRGRQEGWEVNRKRVQRVWRAEGLRVPQARRRKRAVGEGPDGRDIKATAPDDVWALDFQADQTSDGRPIRMVNIIDEHTREALVMHAARPIGADEVVTQLEALVARRGRAPRFVRMDNGPELTSHALRDWCRFSAAGSVFIEPGCPWQNPLVESFHARVRDELLNGEQFACLAEAQVLIDRLARGLQPPPATLRAGNASPGRVRRRPHPRGRRRLTEAARGRKHAARLAPGSPSRRASVRPAS